MAGPGAPVGNQNGVKGREWREAIRRALAHKHGSVKDGLLKVATKLVEAAENGDMAALKEIGDREDGKPVTPIAGSAEDPPVAMSVHWSKPAVD